MSKMAAIDVAVRHQLSRDGKAVMDYTRLMGGDAATGFQYEKNSLELFLIAIANRLRLDTPSYNFSWQELNAETWLTYQLAVLIAQIEAKTTVGAEK